jgi:hypothetical protein
MNQESGEDVHYAWTGVRGSETRRMRLDRDHQGRENEEQAQSSAAWGGGDGGLPKLNPCEARASGRGA